MKFNYTNLQIIYEDNHIIAVNKPAGMLVQGDETGDKPLFDYVKEYIKEKYNKPGEAWLGIPHRLDRPVSGVLIFARTSKALTRLNEMFQTQEMDKQYLAIVKERPEPLSNILINYLVKDKDKNTSKVLEGVSRRHPDAKKCELSYDLVSYLDSHYLLLVKPKTGRPHQIRVQLSHIGCPIVGDIRYGSKLKGHDGNIYLHCLKMEFIHPVKKDLLKIEVLPNGGLWNKFNYDEVS